MNRMFNLSLKIPEKKVENIVANIGEDISKIDRYSP